MRRALDGIGVVLAVLALGGLIAIVQGGTGPAPISSLVGASVPVTTAPVAPEVTPSPTPSTLRPAPRPAQPGVEKDGPAVPASSATTAGPEATPAPPTEAGSDETLYADCDDVEAAGRAPLYRGDVGYRPGLDSDGDGVACEQG